MVTMPSRRPGGATPLRRARGGRGVERALARLRGQRREHVLGERRAQAQQRRGDLRAAEVRELDGGAVCRARWIVVWVFLAYITSRSECTISSPFMPRIAAPSSSPEPASASTFMNPCVSPAPRPPPPPPPRPLPAGNRPPPPPPP